MTLFPALPQAHSQPLFPLPDWPSLPPVTPHNPAQEAVLSAVNTLRRTPGTSPHYGDHYGDITLWDMHTLAHHPAQFLWAVRDSTSVCWLYHDTAGQELLDYYSGRRGLHFFWYHAGTMRPLALSDVPAAFQQLPAAYELSSNHGHFQLRQDRPGSAQPAAAATTTTPLDQDTAQALLDWQAALEQQRSGPWDSRPEHLLQTVLRRMWRPA